MSGGPGGADPAAVIRGLYAALDARDPAAIAACYHPEAAFRDEAFDLRGGEVPAMWHMLVSGGKDLRIECRDVIASGPAGAEAGACRWEAWYTFSATGRKVHNRIASEFRFCDGRIVAQRDRFAFWRWSRQAFGPLGLFLGWTPALPAIVRRKARANLDRFLAAHPEYAEHRRP